MTFEPPTAATLRALADHFGLALDEAEIACYLGQADRVQQTFARLATLPEETPSPRFPRGEWHLPRPEENRWNAWAALTSITGSARGRLRGKRVAIKDSVCVAGMPMTNGGAACLNGYLPELDATVVTRLLAAGAEIRGKAVCEYFCASSGSHTSTTGAVENPRRLGHSTGGSSSGCAALVAAGEVDIAVGGDQAGSIRIPSAHCGIYGMKPTWGLVPYTGAISSEFNIDHLGPMTATVQDNALALQAMAGPDGLDARQTARPRRVDYAKAVGAGAKGLRIGLLSEGFGQPTASPGMDDVVRRAAGKFAALGAELREVSIPWHRNGILLWAAIAREGTYANLMLGGGFGTNHGGLYWTGLQQRVAAWRDRPDDLPYNLRFGLLMGEYLRRRHRGYFYTKAMNLVPQLAAAYDAALTECDLLLLPTAPRLPRPLEPRAASPQAVIEQAFDNVENTSPFDVSHHPALSIPCARLDGSPVGMMLVARRFEEATIYRAAGAFARDIDWEAIS